MNDVLKIIKNNKLSESFVKDLQDLETYTTIPEDIVETTNLVVLMYNNSAIIPMYESMGIYRYLVNNKLSIEVARTTYKYANKVLSLLTNNLTEDSTENYRDSIRSLQLFLVHLNPFINTYMDTDLGRYVIRFMSKLTLEYRIELQSLLQGNRSGIFSYIDTPHLLELPSLYNIVNMLSDESTTELKDLYIRIIETQLNSLAFIKNDNYPFKVKEMLSFLNDYRINLLSLKTLILK